MVIAELPASVLVIDHDPTARQSVRLCLEVDDARVLGVGSATAALEAIERTHFEVVILELWLANESGLELLDELRRRRPELAVIAVSSFASYPSAVDAVRRGACDYLPKPFTPDQLRAATRRALDAVRARPRPAPPPAGEDCFESDSPAYRTLLARASRVAAAEVPALLRGESGTGKNVLARWLWQHSPRKHAPFVTVHCPALSSELMNSALFGHKRGAFTGATSDVIGKVQEAEGGTLFLDEVGDLSFDAQAKLLRFLNDRSFERVGEARELHADVRLIAATNRNLEDEVRLGRFREDLLFRIDVVTLALPPLRERREDLLPLARHYAAPLELSAAAERAIAAYAWPGNLRELRNAIERATILAAGPQLEVADLGLRAAGEPSTTPELGAETSLDAVEREHIARVVARTPSLEAAARILGIDISTLQRKRKRYGLR